MARKRKAGDGTVRQRKDGRWEGRVVIGYARVVGCDGEYMVLNFESGDKAGQDVKYNLTMCLNNGWIEVVD